MSARQTAEPPAAVRTTRKRQNAKTPKPNEARVIGTHIPKPYLDIIEKEATALGLRRGSFLALLLRRKRGQVHLERPPGAPEYSFKYADLTTTERFAWVLDPQIHALLLEDCMAMGNLSVQAWIVVHVNIWLGKPGGFARQPDGKMR